MLRRLAGLRFPPQPITSRTASPARLRVPSARSVAAIIGPTVNRLRDLLLLWRATATFWLDKTMNRTRCLTVRMVELRDVNRCVDSGSPIFAP